MSIRQITDNELALLRQNQDLLHLLELERNTVHALSEQLESVRADAARYRWLIANPLIDISHGRDAEDTPFTLYRVSGSVNDRQFLQIGSGNSLSEAIDAAMKAGGAA